MIRPPPISTLFPYTTLFRSITGEIKRHFRDQGWSVRVPRRLQELHLSLNAAVGELAQKNGRAPTPSELAAHLGIPRAEGLEGLAVANAYRSSSLDERLSGEDDSPPWPRP